MVTLAMLFALSACGGGSGTQPIPAPPTPSAPTPTPPPPPPPPPNTNFNTIEFQRSDGASQHGAITAYQNGATGAGVTVGIIDSGIDVDSAEFAGRISSASADLNGNRGLQDEGGHGSAVSSVIGAAKNDVGVHGIAFNSSLLVLRTDTPGTCSAADPNDPNSGCTHDSGAIAAALNLARQQSARVVNISLGGSGISQSVRSAINAATGAGVIVVVSAGNDAGANPDEFSAAIAASGNGLVIIAGAVDANDALASFTNRAGTQANNYLAALGERVRANDENGTAFLWSGTSFSAPQISGAVALLAQAFPNLSSAQIVDLLLRTATDAGATGTDAEFGRGILNIARAFQPQGQAVLAGTTIALDPAAATGSLSPASGDAVATGSGLNAVILDSYARAFDINLAAGIARAPVSPRLTSALTGERRNMATATANGSIAFSIAPAKPKLITPLTLDGRDASRAELLAASVVSRIAPGTSLSFGIRSSATGLVAQLQGASSPAFLIAADPAQERGFEGRSDSSLALRQKFAGFGITASAESGSLLKALVEPGRERARDRFATFAVALDRQLGAANLALSGSYMDESATLLGTRLAPGFGSAGAQSWFIDGRVAWDLADGWQSSARWRQGWTNLRGTTLITGGRLQTSSFAVDVSKANLLQNGDVFAVRFGQPLRVSSGALTLDLPIAYDYATSAAAFGIRSLNLAPRGRELVSELSYSASLWGGRLGSNLYWRQQPGHFANARDDVGIALRFNSGF